MPDGAVLNLTVSPYTYTSGRGVYTNETLVPVATWTAGMDQQGTARDKHKE